MHAFNSQGIIRKYDSPNAILNEYVGVRLELYGKRRDFMLNALKDKLPYHTNVVRFIRQQCEDVPRPDLRRKSPEECDALLNAQKFVQIKGCFDYLMNLPIASLTLKIAQKHEDSLEALKQSIATMEKTTPKQMWKTELQNLAV
jgi:DNA topoisomerase-2